MKSLMQTCRYINSNNRNRGFTLLEVIVVIGLSVMVLTLVYGTLFYGGKNAAKARADIVKKNEILRQFHRIRFQLLNLYTPDSGVSLQGEEGIREYRSELYFITSSLKYNKGVGEVGYKMMTDSDGSEYLGYTEFPYPREDRFAVNNQLDKWYIASPLIKGLTVEYLQGADWVNKWKEKKPPESIRVILWYEGEVTGREPELLPYTFMVSPGVTSVLK